MGKKFITAERLSQDMRSTMNAIAYNTGVGIILLTLDDAGMVIYCANREPALDSDMDRIVAIIKRESGDDVVYDVVQDRTEEEGN